MKAIAKTTNRGPRGIVVLAAFAWGVVIGISVPLPDARSLAGRRARAYDPWKKIWVDATIDSGAVRLPAFARSIVVRVTLM